MPSLWSILKMGAGIERQSTRNILGHSRRILCSLNFCQITVRISLRIIWFPLVNLQCSGNYGIMSFDLVILVKMIQTRKPVGRRCSSSPVAGLVKQQQQLPPLSCPASSPGGEGKSQASQEALVLPLLWARSRRSALRPLGASPGTCYLPPHKSPGEFRCLVVSKGYTDLDF